MKCKYCNNEIIEGSMFCPNCGKKIEDSKKSGKVPLIYLLLGSIVFVVVILGVVKFISSEKKDNLQGENRDASVIEQPQKKYIDEMQFNNYIFDVNVNPDGSMDVVETWDIDILKVNTLFKDFKLDSSKYSEITNVSVKEIIPNDNNLKQIYQEQYHVDEGCFYALDIGNDTFEIAWNVGLDNTAETRTYQISYTVKDVVKIYNDCTELYWAVFGEQNSIPAKNVKGTVKLPKAVSDIEKLKIWGHGPFDGKAKVKSEDTVTFRCDNLDEGELLEFRIVTEENIFDKCKNIINSDKLESILDEESIHFEVTFDGE